MNQIHVHCLPKRRIEANRLNEFVNPQPVLVRHQMVVFLGEHLMGIEVKTIHFIKLFYEIITRIQNLHIQYEDKDEDEDEGTTRLITKLEAYISEHKRLRGYYREQRQWLNIRNDIYETFKLSSLEPNDPNFFIISNEEIQDEKNIYKKQRKSLDKNMPSSHAKNARRAATKVVKKRKVYRGKSGGLYELRRSKVTGKMYKKYLGSRNSN